MIDIFDKLNAAYGDNTLADSDQIKDKKFGKKQDVLNKEILDPDDPNSLKSKVDSFNGIVIDPDNVVSTDKSDIEVGSSKIPTGNAVAGALSDAVLKAGVFDISAYNLTNDQPTPYADLEAALGNNGENVPKAVRKGGMQVKFIQGSVGSSDNKYVQARCMAQNFTTDVTQWQGVDDEPTAGSDNLVKSGGVRLSVEPTTFSNIPFVKKQGWRVRNGEVTEDLDGIVKYIEVKSGDKVRVALSNTSSFKSLYIGFCQGTPAIGTAVQEVANVIDKVSSMGMEYADVTIASNGYLLLSYFCSRLDYDSPADGRYSFVNLNALYDTYIPKYGLGFMTLNNANNPDPSVAAKIITNAPEGYVPTLGYPYVVRLYAVNTADNCTLNINNTGAKNLYYNGYRASSTNTWKEDTFVLLWHSGSEYYMFELDFDEVKTTINNLAPVYGVTVSNKYNGLLRELYLTGIDETKTYWLRNIQKNSTAWKLQIEGHWSGGSGTVLASVEITTEEGKKPFVRFVERNSSGISGYGIVDWNAIPDNTAFTTVDIDLITNRIANIDFSPTIKQYLSDDTLKEDVVLSNDVYTLAENIKAERDYFLNDTYADETSYADTSYLDSKLRDIPEGKHFLFVTDSHIGYDNGMALKETEIMDYVKAKLNAGAVVFGGDAVGQQDTPYKAAKELAVYSEDKFNAFGSEFLWCQGNHDANANTNSANSIPSTEIYKRTTKIMQRYGKAVFDEEGIAFIDTLGLSAANAAEAKAWMNLHYYYDDVKNKIRFIVIETGDGSNGGSIFGNAWDGYENITAYITFIGEALQSAPDGWDAVVVMHQLAPSGNFYIWFPNQGWERISRNGSADAYDSSKTYQVDEVCNILGDSENSYKSLAVQTGNFPAYQDEVELSPVTHTSIGDLYSLLSAFKKHTTATVRGDGSITQAARPVLYAFMNERIGNGVTFDFTNRTSGRAFTLSGHFHMDDAWVIQNSQSSVWRYKGKEYGQWDTILDNSILAIQTDRATINDQGSMAGSAKAPNGVSYPNNNAEVRIGTKNEVLFDIVTITPDNKVVCTRIGAGSDRIYDIP